MEASAREILFTAGAVGLLVARSFARFVLRRRRGVNVGRHYVKPLDLLKSVLFSLSDTYAGNYAVIGSFAAAVLARRFFRRVADTVFGRRPGKRTVARLARLAAVGVSRHLGAWLCGGAFIWFAHWRIRVCERPVVSCKRTYWNVAIVEKAGFARREFKPVFWLTSRHAQTVLAHVLADLSFLLLRPVKWYRESFATFDGGEVHLDWLVRHDDEFAPYGDGVVPSPEPRSAARADAAPIALLLYGVGGSRDDHYMKHLSVACATRGWRPAVLTYWRLDWNEWRDLDAAVERIAARNPNAPLFVIAHSASAFLLVQYLAARGAGTPVVAAVTLAGCLDFLRTTDFVNRTKNITYRKVFERGLRRCVLRHAAHDPNIASPEKRREHARRIVSLRGGTAVMRVRPRPGGYSRPRARSGGRGAGTTGTSRRSPWRRTWTARGTLSPRSTGRASCGGGRPRGRGAARPRRRAGARPTFSRGRGRTTWRRRGRSCGTCACRCSSSTRATTPS